MAKIGCLKPFRGSYNNIKDVVLEDGEIAFETTNKCIYMGNGINPISSMIPFISGDSLGNQHIEGPVGLSVDLYRVGNVVSVTVFGTTTQALNWRNVIAAFPDGYEPVTSSIILLTDYIEPADNVAVYLSNITNPTVNEYYNLPYGGLIGNITIPSGKTVQGGCVYICQ